MIGPPGEAMDFPRMGQDSWEYRYRATWGYTAFLSVNFDRTGFRLPLIVVGGFVMVTDPIFQGLAVALMSGAVVATLLTMIVVPILYWELRRREVALAPVAVPALAAA